MSVSKQTLFLLWSSWHWEYSFTALKGHAVKRWDPFTKNFMYLTSEYQIYEGHMQIKNLGQEMVFLKEKKNT